MNSTAYRSSVIVIHGTNNRYDYESVRTWFESSGFDAYEAADLFDAIDKLSDFTDPGSPDVFLVRVEPGSQQDKIIGQFACDIGIAEIPIAVLSDAADENERMTFNFGSVRGLKASLDQPPVLHA